MSSPHWYAEGKSSSHMCAIVQLPTFMGYVNPARSSPAGMKLSTVGSGQQSFKGLVDGTSPLKMISFGVVKYSNLVKASQVRARKVLLVKSMNIFPLPGEWERTVGFFGTCAKASSLLFSPYQGALSYSTRMLPAPGSNGTVGLVPGLSATNFVLGSS